ncbi:MAG: DUF2306 domain-containing protein [Inquilinus limosus]|uniref:DUF2306 domain-containing protein n=1 Tax=Inquilinus limosus TaxID=171674 RepID=A0A952KJC7_9PROT|nr:DUF2306 domain-containing protein [Inquilinus limosus]
MVAIEPTRRALRLPRPKTVVFGLILAMTAYVIVHNERFLIEPDHPVWQHYKSFQWWLLPHGVAGASALLLAPLQFSDRLRRRYAAVHRVVGRIYVAGVFVFAPLGAYIQWLNEAAGASRSFTVAAAVDAALVMVTTGIGLAFALKRMIPQHRQWMTRSYAVALVFFEGRLILGLTGLDRPSDPAVAEIVVWTCVALAVLVGDLANQWTELQGRRRPPAR